MSAMSELALTPLWEPGDTAELVEHLDRVVQGARIITDSFVAVVGPPIDRTGGSFGFVFDDDGRVLLVRHPTRGWELPGGHIDEGEDACHAFEREVAEEGRVRVRDVRLLGYRRNVVPDPAPGYSYATRDTYVCYFTARADGPITSGTDDEFVEEIRYFAQTDVTDENVAVAGARMWDAALRRLRPA